MAPEPWGIAAVLLLATAAVACGLNLRQMRGRWGLLAFTARTAAAMAVAMAMILAAVRHGQWSPFDLTQVAFSLALATVVIYLALAWRFRIDVAAPAVDLLALALIATTMLAVRAGGPSLTCAQKTLPFVVHWVLSLVGAGGAMVAGSTGLMLILAGRRWLLPTISRRLAPQQWPPAVDQRLLLRQATLLALVFLGGGLAMGVWWTWQAEGTLTSSDPRTTWLAITWLIMAMSLPAQHLPRRSGQWAASLVMVAAAAAIVGLLALLDLRRLLGM